VFKDDSTGRKALSPFCQTHNIFCDAIWSSPGFPVLVMRRSNSDNAALAANDFRFNKSSLNYGTPTAPVLIRL